MKVLNEGNQIHNFISSSGSGTVINYGSGSDSDFLTSYGSCSVSTRQSYGSYGSGSTTLFFFLTLNLSFGHKNRSGFRQTMIRIRTERLQLRNTGIKVVKLPHVSMVGGGFLIFLPWRPVLRFQRPLRGRIPNHRIRLGDPLTKKGIFCCAKSFRYQDSRQYTDMYFV